MDEGRFQELHRTARTGVVRVAAVAVPAVVRLDPPDRGEDGPVEAEPRGRLLVQDEVVGRDVGDRGRRVGHLRAGERGPVAGENPDRSREDDESDERDRTARERAAEAVPASRGIGGFVPRMGLADEVGWTGREPGVLATGR